MGLGYTVGQILASPIEMAGHPYNYRAPCDISKFFGNPATYCLSNLCLIAVYIFRFSLVFLS